MRAHWHWWIEASRSASASVGPGNGILGTLGYGELLPYPPLLWVGEGGGLGEILEGSGEGAASAARSGALWAAIQLVVEGIHTKGKAQIEDRRGYMKAYLHLQTRCRTFYNAPESDRGAG